MDSSDNIPYQNLPSINNVNNAQFSEQIQSLVNFHQQWKAFKEAVVQFPEPLYQELIRRKTQSHRWETILAYKIYPASATQKFLFVAVAGGANTGKSTLTNVLVQQEVTPTSCYSSATKRAVLITTPEVVQQCYEGYFPIDLNFRPMDSFQSPLSTSNSPHTVFVNPSSNLWRKDLLLFDTPDFDSNDLTNWEIAEKIVTTADVVIAIITEQKYNDERVVNFFKRAKEEGKTIIPIMNQVYNDSEESLNIAKNQTALFLKEIDSPDSNAFYFPKYSATESLLHEPIPPFNPTHSNLREYLQSLPLEKVKSHAIEKSIEIFYEELKSWRNQNLFPLINFLEHELETINAELLDVVEKGYNPYGILHLKNEILKTFRKQVGTMNYYLLYPTSILPMKGQRWFSPENKQEAEIELKLKEKHKEELTLCFHNFLMKLHQRLYEYPDPWKNFLIDRLNKINKRKEDTLALLIQKMEEQLPLTSDSISQEIERLVERWKNQLGGYKFLRIVSLLSTAAGAGLLFFSGQWYLLLSGAGFGISFITEHIGYKYLLTDIENLHQSWLKEKKAYLYQNLKSLILNDLLEHIPEYLALLKSIDGQINIVIQNYGANCTYGTQTD